MNPRAIALSLSLLPATQVAGGSIPTEPTEHDSENMSVTANVELVGGAFVNNHLRDGTAGREHQGKMTRAILGLDLIGARWESKLELVGIGDEIYQSANDRAYMDIYRNLGTDIYYYGDMPVREAWVGQNLDGMYWRVGRVINLMGQRPGGYFETAGESPNSVILATGIFNGVQAGVNLADGRVKASLGVMGGNDKPRLGANNYLDGTLDVNEKGNDTPAIEVYAVAYPSENVRLYGGYLFNKKGSAPGVFESGRHNDSRLVYGFESTPYKSDWASANIGVQGFTFTRGLTEDGMQGETTGTQSYDIEQNGWFATANLSFPKVGVSLRYTYEEMDRMDPIAWRDIAGFDKTHPVNDAQESRSIVSIEKGFGSGFAVRAFYRQDNVPYLTSSDEGLEDRGGIVFSYRRTL